jgi:hypothetical protein
MIYVLIIISHVYGGQTVTTHDFETPEACERAKGFVSDKDRGIWAACLPKR